MVFYIVIIGKIELNVSRMLIGQDLRRTEGFFFFFFFYR